ncbi:MAG: hypothetical protein GEU28_02420 [Dehalococcoidia bacterium]|nr:hypothetical protein [Dehalococcoidia bacterium]
MVAPARNRAFLGVVAVVGALVAALFLALTVLGGSGDDQPACDRVAGLPITQLPIDQERFDTAFQGIAETRDLTQRASSAPPQERQELLSQAFSTFYLKAHDLTHDFDFDLCEANYDLAEELRLSMVNLENALGAQNNPQAILAGLDEVELQIQEANEYLL